MHSRIYGIVRKDKEIYEEEKESVLSLTDTELHESMSGVADYISEDTDLEEDCKWLEENYGYMFEFTSENSFRLNKKEIGQYLTEKINKLKEILNNTSTPNELIKNTYNIKNLADNEYEFYFVQGFNAETLDNFVKEEYLEEQDLEFEIVKTWDYHF